MGTIAPPATPHGMGLGGTALIIPQSVVETLATCVSWNLGLWWIGRRKLAR